MLAQLAADLLVILHLAFILLVIFGSLLLWRFPRLVWLHLPAAVWGVLIEFSGWLCPLTPLENRLRRLAGEQGYSGSFIENYLLPVIYPAGLTRDLQWILGAGVLLVNLLGYGFWLYQRRTSALRQRPRKTPSARRH